MTAKHETHRTPAPIVGTHTIPGNNVDPVRTKAGAVGRTNERTGAIQVTGRGRTLIEHVSSSPCVHVSPVGSDHGSPSEWEGSRRVAAGSSSSQ